MTLSGVRPLHMGVVAALAIGFLVVSAYGVLSTTSERILARQAEQAALRWSRYISHEIGSMEDILAGAPLSGRDQEFLEGVREFGTVFGFRLFDSQGRLRLRSDDLNTPKANGPSLRDHSSKAASVVTTGKFHTEMNENTGDASLPAFYVKSFVPVFRKDQTIGVVEVCLDFTAERTQMRDQFAVFALQGDRPDPSGDGNSRCSDPAYDQGVG